LPVLVYQVSAEILLWSHIAANAEKPLDLVQGVDDVLQVLGSI
jgi:hypothetical protein